jgi:predicted Fe-S protein YdhL (DUF1289 family)
MSIIDSPCVRNCCLDDTDVCIGCYRTLDEIKAWLSLPDAEKQVVLLLCQQRREAALARRKMTDQ